MLYLKWCTSTKKRPSYAWIEHPLNQEALSCRLRSTNCGSETHVVNDFDCDNYLWSKTFFGYENHEFDALVYVLSDWSPFNSLK